MDATCPWSRCVRPEGRPGAVFPRPLYVLLLLLLAGCGTAETFLMPSELFAVSRPYEGRHRNALAVSGITLGASVVVFPVAGLPEGKDEALAAAVQTAAVKRDIPVFLRNGAETADQLLGRARLHLTEAGLWLEVFWQLRDFASQQRAQFTTTKRLAAPDRSRASGWADPPELDNAAAWQFLTDEALAEVGAAAAVRLQDILTAAQGRDPATETVRSAIVMLPVEDAPGDGRRSLTRMMALLLEEAGYTVEIMWDGPPRERLPAGTVVIASRVAVSEPERFRRRNPNGQGFIEDEMQTVTLGWGVFDNRGQSMGQINQTNRIPAGSLDGPWGENAVYAAQGARDGLLQLLANLPGR